MAFSFISVTWLCVDFIFILSNPHNLSTESQNHAGIHSQRNLWPWQSETLFFFSFFLFSVFFSHEGCNITTWPLQVYWKSQEGYTWINTNCVYMCMFVCVCGRERGESVRELHKHIHSCKRQLSPLILICVCKCMCVNTYTYSVEVCCCSHAYCMY